MDVAGKVLKIAAGFFSIAMASLLVWSIIFSLIVRPYEINQNIKQSCVHFREYGVARSNSTYEQSLTRSSFARLARQDPRYLELSKAADMYSYISTLSNQSDISFRLKLFEARSTIQGFCAVRAKINTGLNPNDLQAVPSKNP